MKNICRLLLRSCAVFIAIAALFFTGCDMGDSTRLPSFTVSFNANGGDGMVPAAQMVSPGSSITIPPGSGLSKNGFTFSGWNTSAGGSGISFSAGAPFTPSADIILHAMWIPAFTVSFNANSGGGTVPDPQTVTPGSGITIPGGSGLSKSGHIFGGWNTSPAGTGTTFHADASYTPAASVTLYALWIPGFTVTFNANGAHGTVAPQTAYSGDSITIPGSSGLSKSGFTFAGWNTNADGTGTVFDINTTYTPSGDITLYAIWTATVTFNINNGSGTTPPSWTENADANITLPGSGGFSRSGFIFSGWNTMPDGSGNSFSAGATYAHPGNITLYARWLAVFTVAFNANNGTGAAPDSREVNEGGSTTLPGDGGLSRAGHVFGGWNTMPDGSGRNYRVLDPFTPTGNITLYARWLVIWTAAANDTTNTTGINFTFGAPVSGLTDDDITVTAGTATVTRGALTGSGTSWSLPITVTSLGSGTLSVSINRPGIENRTETMTVSRPPVSWAASVSGAPYTNAINFEFAGPVAGLTPGNITVTKGTGLVTTGILTGSGTSWSLAVGVARAGEIEVSISRAGIESRTETLEVSAVSWTAAANSIENTTAINFTFSEPITGLTAAQITVSAGTVTATRETLTGNGTSWSLAVTVAGRGNVLVYINRPGIESGPRTVDVYVPPFRLISAGETHTVAIRDGELWAWGNNANGQLGDGTTNTRWYPVRIGARTDWVHVFAGNTHTMAIREDGTLWAWGNALDGRTGLGLMSGNTTTPFQVGTATDWTYVSAGFNHTVGIREDAFGNRTLWAWGNNAHGQLGIGGTTSQNLPQRVGTDTNWATVSAGGGLSGQWGGTNFGHTVASRTDGTLWAWGGNHDGRLGLGQNSSASTTIPTRVGTATNWASVSTGGAHTVATRRDGSLWAWGSNHWNQLGDGDTSTVRTTPVRIGADNDWASVSAGLSYTVAVRTTGSLWVWGSNTNGRLGDGTTTSRNVPTLIQLGTTWGSVSAGSAHTVAVRSDGTFWTWGLNTSGQLGDGTTTQRTSPVWITIP